MPRGRYFDKVDNILDKLSKEEKPKINIFETIAKEFYDDEAVLNVWAKESIFVSNLLTDKNFTATAETIALLKARIQKSKDDVDSALTDDLADRLLAKVAEIEAQLV